MNNSAIAEETWEDVRKRIFTPEELAESSLWVAFMGELIDARDKGISKKELAKLSGVSAQSIIRMTTGDTDPKISSVLKVLGVFGKTLAIVPIEEVLKEEDQFREQGEEQVESISDSVTQLPN